MTAGSLPAGLILDSVGGAEWVVLGAVILIVYGPKRLPDILRRIGRTLEQVRRSADAFRSQLMSLGDELAHPPRPESPAAPREEAPSWVETSSDSPDPDAGDETGDDAGTSSGAAPPAAGEPET